MMNSTVGTAVTKMQGMQTKYLCYFHSLFAISHIPFWLYSSSKPLHLEACSSTNTFWVTHSISIIFYLGVAGSHIPQSCNTVRFLEAAKITLSVLAQIVLEDLWAVKFRLLKTVQEASVRGTKLTLLRFQIWRNAKRCAGQPRDANGLLLTLNLCHFVNSSTTVRIRMKLAQAVSVVSLDVNQVRPINWFESIV